MLECEIRLLRLGITIVWRKCVMKEATIKVMPLFVLPTSCQVAKVFNLSTVCQLKIVIGACNWIRHSEFGRGWDDGLEPAHLINSFDKILGPEITALSHIQTTALL